MTWLGLSTGGAYAPNKLDPPATLEELAWWRQARGTFRRDVILRTTLLAQVPLFAGLAYMRGWTFLASWAGVRMLGGFVVITAISGAAQWGVIRNVRFRHELIAKRLRQAITAPEEAITATDDGTP